MNCSAFLWYWECTWKNPLFQPCSALALEFKISTIKFLGYSISGCPLFGFPICDKRLLHVFRNEKESETAIAPFEVTLYLFRVCNQWCMYFMFLLHFLIFACFYNRFDWYIFLSTVRLQTIFNCYNMIFSWLQRLLVKSYKLLFYQKSFKFRFSRRHTMIYGMSPSHEFWTVIIPGS